MKKILLLAFLTTSFSVIAAEGSPTGEIKCDPNDEKCCERIANGGRTSGEGAPAPVASPTEDGSGARR